MSFVTIQYVCSTFSSFVHLGRHEFPVFYNKLTDDYDHRTDYNDEIDHREITATTGEAVLSGSG